MSNESCVILTPVADHVEPHCELSLKQLEEAGYVVRRWFGASAVDAIRNRLVTAALRDGFDEIMWIDSDIAFHPTSVDRLRSHHLSIVCGLYPTKVECGPTWAHLAENESLVFGEAGGLTEIKYAPAGFLYTKGEVYDRIQQQNALPLCNSNTKEQLVPYFLPMIHTANGQHWYLGEDFAFCERARQCGYRVFADTTILLQHIGRYGYSWKDLERS